MDPLLIENLEDRFKDVESSFSYSIESYNELLQNPHDFVRNKIDYIKNEIDIRVESLKNDLDAAREELYSRFDCILNDLVVKVNQTLESQNTKQPFSMYNRELEILREDIQNKQHMSLSRLLDYERSLSNIKKRIQEIDFVDPEKIFRLNTNKPQTGLIGTVLYKFDLDGLANVFDQSSFNKIPTTDKIISLCALPDNNLLTCGERFLSLYDLNFNLIKEEKHAYRRGTVCSVLTNNRNRVYVVCYEGFQMKDLSLNDTQEFVDAIKHLDFLDIHDERIFDACYYNDNLYACVNRSIMKFSEILSLENSYALACRPVACSIIDGIAFVVDYGRDALLFDANDDFKLLRSIPIAISMKTISSFGSYFYHYNEQMKNVMFFDKSGDLVETLATPFIENGDKFMFHLTHFQNLIVIGSLCTKKMENKLMTFGKRYSIEDS